MDKKILFVLALLIGSALVAAWLRGNFSRQATAASVRVTIGKQQYAVEVADTMPAQAQGLSGRESLAPGTGMLFVFSAPREQTFWMHGMQFPIDIVWIRDNVVVGFVEEAPIPSGLNTPTFTSPEPADLVLELPAGTVAAQKIKSGDTVSISGYTKDN